MNTKLIKVIGIYILMYIIHFLILPVTNNLVGAKHPDSNILLTLSSIIIVITMIIISDKFSHIFIGNIVYTLLIFLYCPPRIYDIGMVGVDLDGLTSGYDPSYKNQSILYFGIASILIDFIKLTAVKIGKYIINKFSHNKIRFEYKKVNKIIGMYMLIYVIQFIIAPLFINIYFIGRIEGYLFLIISFLIMTGITMKKVSDKFYYWFIGFSIYMLLAIIHTPIKIYAPEFLDLDSMDIYTSDMFIMLIITEIYLFISNFILWIVFKVSKRIKGKKLIKVLINMPSNKDVKLLLGISIKIEFSGKYI